MGVQASAQVTWQAESAQEALDTVNAWVVHEGAEIVLLVEQPVQTVTSMVMTAVSQVPVIADGDGSVTIEPDDPDAWAPPDVPDEPDELPPDEPAPPAEPDIPDEEPVVPDEPAELSASFTYDRPVMGADTQFDATASTGSIETYDWTFAGVKQSDAGPTPTWQFAKNGTYTVKLVVTDADGATATDSQSVKVFTA